MYNTNGCTRYTVNVSLEAYPKIGASRNHCTAPPTLAKHSIQSDVSPIVQAGLAKATKALPLALSVYSADGTCCMLLALPHTHDPTMTAEIVQVAP